MNTIAHIVIAAAALTRPDTPKRNWAVLFGAAIPDASMFVFFAWSRLQGWSGDETWNVQYWKEPWQALGAASNSCILFGLLLAAGLWRRGTLLALFSAAALIHIGLDFPLHADDAHRHFWPLSDWRFASPISYWDPNANGWVGSLIETLCVVAAAALLWRRFPLLKWRLLLAGLALLQSAAFAAQIAWTH